jgi:hypothetical protein
MTLSGNPSPATELVLASVYRPVPVRDATWRYIGERAAADLAYCVRFGVALAPLPSIALGGAWAYPLPAAAPLR